MRNDLRNNWIRIAAGTLLALVASVLLFGWGAYRPFPRIRELHERYEQATQGMTIGEVEDLMGSPGERSRFRPLAWWDEQRLDNEVLKRTKATISYTVKTWFCAHVVTRWCPMVSSATSEVRAWQALRCN